MTEDTHREEDAVERVATLVPGPRRNPARRASLRGGLYLIQGAPGMGKTILASQIAYRWAAMGSRALFATVLRREPRRMMMHHLRQMSFFDPALIPDNLYYISAYRALDEEGLAGVAALISREIRTRKAALLILDGASAVEAKAQGVFELKRFYPRTADLWRRWRAAPSSCSPLERVPNWGRSAPWWTVLIELKTSTLRGCARSGGSSLQKLRGSSFLEGEHAFRITREGVMVLSPRIEAIHALPTVRRPPSGRRLVHRHSFA